MTDTKPHRWASQWWLEPVILPVQVWCRWEYLNHPFEPEDLGLVLGPTVTMPLPPAAPWLTFRVVPIAATRGLGKDAGGWPPPKPLFPILPPGAIADVRNEVVRRGRRR